MEIQMTSEKETQTLGESERSTQVLSANWKEETMFQQHLRSLNRAERTVVHRITIDQTLMYRQFQMKLLRSKLARARLFGDKEKEKEILSSKKHRLNTDPLVNSKEMQFLRKLQTQPIDVKNIHRPVSDMFTKRVPSIQVSTTSRSKTARQTGRSKSVSGDMHCKVGLNTPNTFLNVPDRQIRPATTAGARVEEEFFTHSNKQKNNSKCESPNFDDEVEDMVKFVVGNGYDDAEITNEIPHLKDQPTVLLERDVTLIEPPSIHTSRSHSRQHTARSQSRRKSVSPSIFCENKKEETIKMRLEELKSHDFTTQVRQFCDSVTYLRENTGSNRSDYYSQRLNEMTGKSATTASSGINVPDSEHKRHLGDMTARSLTMQTLDLNL